MTDEKSATTKGENLGKDEPEITPEMIEAGADVLWESGAVENPMEGADRELVQRIFVAMVRVKESRP